jgi:hypothetical protein
VDAPCGGGFLCVGGGRALRGGGDEDGESSGCVYGGINWVLFDGFDGFLVDFEPSEGMR